MTKTLLAVLALVGCSYLVGCAAQPMQSEEQGSTESNQLTSKQKRRKVNAMCPTAADSVERAYLIALGREPDADGEAYWVGQIESGAQTRIGVLRNIIASPEFAAKDTDLSNADYVEGLYNNLLGRASDAEGKAYWQGALDGGRSRPQVALDFTNAPEFTDMEINFNAPCFFE